MSPERWKEIYELFEAELAQEAAQRQEFVRRQAGADAVLRGEVEALLAADADENHSLLDVPLAQLAAEVLPAEAATLSGRTLGRYRIERELGRGGMGEVYLAQDVTLGRQVAVKVLPPAFLQDAERVRRFRQEARAASALNHPNIVTIHELGEADGQQFIVTEYIAGETLRERLRREPLTWAQTLDIARQVCGVLAAAHASGITHRDIKPENIMLRPDGYVKVLDFGLAKITAPQPLPAQHLATASKFQTRPGVVLGTVTYMSPEQVRGEAVDGRSDIFSLGVVLYEMLAGRVPFTGTTPSHIVVAILEHTPSALTALTPAVPPELERIVNRALAKDYASRYPTAQACGQDLALAMTMLERGELSHAPTVIMETAPQNSGSKGSKGAAASHNAQTVPLAVSSAPDQFAAVSGAASASIASTTPRLRVSLRAKLLGTLVLLLIAGGLAMGVRYFYSVRTDSLAVLPFMYQTASEGGLGLAQRDYLADGLTESIMQNLSQVPHLKVIARASVFRFKGQENDPQSVGRALGVRAILTGRIRQADNKLTISVELIEVTSGARLWGDSYETPAAEVLAVQRRIASNIAEQLQVSLTGQARQRIAHRYTDNTVAYQLYLKGRYFWNKRTHKDLQEAIGYYKQALAQDPDYALAYAALAETYVLLPVYGDTAPDLAIPTARVALTEALRRDDQLAEAHTARAVIASDYDNDQLTAEQAFRRALEVNPNYATAHHWYSSFLASQGRFDEARAEANWAKELDPVSLAINTSAGYVAYLCRDYDQAIVQLEKTLTLYPNANGTRLHLSDAYREKGRYADALAEVQKVVANRSDTASQSRLAIIYAKTGKAAEALKIAQSMQPEPYNSPYYVYYLATIYAALGDKTRALEYLERDAAAKDPYLRWLKVDPLLDSLRAEPRFLALQQQVR